MRQTARSVFFLDYIKNLFLCMDIVGMCICFYVKRKIAMCKWNEKGVSTMSREIVLTPLYNKLCCILSNRYYYFTVTLIFFFIPLVEVAVI